MRTLHRGLICGASKHKCAVATVNGTRWCAWYHRLYIYILMVVYGLLYIDAEVNDKLQHMHMTGRWVRFYLGSLVSYTEVCCLPLLYLFVFLVVL